MLDRHPDRAPVVLGGDGSLHRVVAALRALVAGTRASTASLSRPTWTASCARPHRAGPGRSRGGASWPGSRDCSFSKSVGGVLQIRVQVCRGNATRPVGECSRWKTIYTQGG